MSTESILQPCRWADCSVTCTTVKDLFDHVFVVHCVRANAVERKLVCRWYRCNVKPRFGGPASPAAKHIATHTGIQPFECAQCTERFAQRHKLETHIRLYHAATTKPASSQARPAGVETGTKDDKAAASEEELDWVDSPRARPSRSVSPALSALSSLSADSSQGLRPRLPLLSTVDATMLRCQWPACGLTLASGAELLDHLHKAHAKQGPASQTCEWNMCGRLCIGERGMLRHVKGHLPTAAQKPRGGDSPLQPVRVTKRAAVDNAEGSSRGRKRVKEEAALSPALSSPGQTLHRSVDMARGADATPDVQHTEETALSSVGMNALSGRPRAPSSETAALSPELDSAASLVVRMANLIDEYKRRVELEQKRKDDESMRARSDCEARAFEASDWSVRFYQGYTDMYDV